MFKLNSVNGKFDIVFAGDLDTEDKAKIKCIRGTSAGRRKNAEWKSHLFDKKKRGQIDVSKIKSNKTSKLRLAKDRERKLAPNVTPRTDEELEEALVPDISNDRKQSGTKKDAEPEKDAETENSSNVSITRRDTYLKQCKNDDSSYVSQEQLNTLFTELFNEAEAEKVEKPPSIQSPDNETKDIPIEESTLMHSSRQKEIRKKQATPDCEYYPWGRPGGGAPIKAEDPGNIRAELRRSIKLQDERQEAEKLNESLNSSGNAGNNLNKSMSKKNRSFARGQVKQQHELDDLEKRRLKHLEHEREIAKQVEEKRLAKKLAREAQLREEQEAEARFQREREMLQKRMEEEKKKQKEKEEEKRKQQELIEESIKKAYDEAVQAKKQARLARTMNAEKTDNETQSRKAKYESEATQINHQAYRKQYSNESEKITSQKLKEETSYLPVSGDENELTRNSIRSSHEYETEKKTITKASKIPKPKKTKNAQNDQPQESRKVKKKIKKRSSELTENNYVEHCQVETKDETRKLNRRKEEKNAEETLNNLVDDYLVPFHRTKTEVLQHDDIEDWSKESVRRNDDPFDIERFSSPETPSRRQQQIIKQLHALRQGLMEKQREHILPEYHAY